jgi:glycosyltransferase involved in cell wall biosynthesis
VNQIDLKILQLVSVRWWNASAYYAISLAEALQQAGIFTVVGGKETSPPIRKAKTWQLSTIGDLHLESLNPMHMVKNLNKLTSVLHQHQINVINAHRAEDMTFSVLVKKRLQGTVPVIRTVSDVRAPKRRPLNKKIHQNVDFFIFTCKASYERYQAVWPIFADKSAVIYSAIDTKKFSPLPHYTKLREQLGFGANDIVIGLIARLDPVKDHHSFLYAAALLAKEFPLAKFLIAGEPCNITIPMLETLATDLGIRERVVLVPRNPAITAKDLIGSIDIGVVASKGSEVICRIAVEYMAMGKPLVVTDINVLPEIVDDGENGLVVPAASPQSMANALKTLCSNSDLRKKMGHTARQYAINKYSYPVLVKETLQAYQKVLTNNR